MLHQQDQSVSGQTEIAPTSLNGRLVKAKRTQKVSPKALLGRSARTKFRGRLVRRKRSQLRVLKRLLGNGWNFLPGVNLFRMAGDPAVTRISRIPAFLMLVQSECNCFEFLFVGL